MTEQLHPSCQEFISRLTHEIRNDLTLISSSMQLLESDCPAVVQSDLWTQIQTDLNSVFHLLSDISALNIRQKLCLSRIPAVSFLTAVTSSFYPLAASRNILFSADLSALSSSSALIDIDKIKLREVLINLLVNAVDAVTASCISPQILLLAETDEHCLHIHVKDNGPGIPENCLSTLFDPFVTYKSSGTGLGLNIVKTITELHHGTVVVHTDCTPEHSWTDFCISLPLVK